MSENEVTLKFVVPGESEPGFLKRQREALVFRSKLQDEVEPETLDELVSYLAQFVVDPPDQKGKEEALWMATQNQFMALLGALTGDDEENPTE